VGLLKALVPVFCDPVWAPPAGPPALAMAPVASVVARVTQAQSKIVAVSAITALAVARNWRFVSQRR